MARLCGGMSAGVPIKNIRLPYVRCRPEDTGREEDNYQMSSGWRNSFLRELPRSAEQRCSVIITLRATRIRALNAKHERIIAMLYTIAVVLLILWLLGLVTSYTMGGFIHILLVIALVVVLLRVISGRRAV
jgi:hypothetical protein